MLNSYPWYLADWRNSETRAKLSMAQKGLYREMIDYCFLEGSCPVDANLLTACCGPRKGLTPTSTKAVTDLFDRRGDRYYHKKVEEVRAKLLSYHEVKRHAGVKSGQSRRQRKNEHVFDSVPTSPTPTPTPTPVTPPPPKGAGEQASLLPVEKPQKFEDLVAEAAARIRNRHPEKRRCSLSEVITRLKAITARVPKAERVDRLVQVESVHAAWCDTWDWQKEDGCYAKGLDNWLAPTKGRFDDMPPVNGSGNGHHATPDRMPTAAERRRIEVIHGLEMIDRIKGRA